MNKKLFTSAIPLIVVVAIVCFASPQSKTAEPQTKPVNNRVAVECSPALSYVTNFNAKAFQPPANSLIRKNIKDLTQNEWNLISKAYLKMKSLPSSDPTSWAFQNKIHGGAPDPKDPAIGNCQHSNCFFLAWHRMYLHFFERIMVSKMASNPTQIGLPYWDSDKNNNASNAILPLLFRRNTFYGQKNGFFNSTRSADAKNGKDLDKFNATKLNYQFAMLPTVHNIFEFQRRIEIAHGDIHVKIGGDMKVKATAAKDPVFFSHHANIDRLWEVWLRKGSTTGNDRRCNLANHMTAELAAQKFYFYDEAGQQVTLTAAQIMDLDALNYSYDDANTKGLVQTTNCKTGSGPCEPQPQMKQTGGAPKKNINYSATNVSLNSEKEELRLSLITDASLLQNFNANRYKLELQILNPSFTSLPNDLIEVYVNPANKENLTATDNSFLGTIYTFGLTENTGMAHNRDLILDATIILKSQFFQNLNSASANINLFFVCRDRKIKKHNFKIGEVKLVLQEN
jgi:hypothetical protein